MLRYRKIGELDTCYITLYNSFTTVQEKGIAISITYVMDKDKPPTIKS